MDELLKQIYELYCSEEYYTKKVFDDPEYKVITKKLVSLESQLKNAYNDNHDHEEYINHLIDEFFVANTSLSLLYRYFDFTQGFCSGIAVGMLSNHLNKPEFIQDIMQILEKQE